MGYGDGTVPVESCFINPFLLKVSASHDQSAGMSPAPFVRKGVRITPFIEGGIQEDGRRAGTENVPGLVGLRKATELASKRMAEFGPRLTRLRDRLILGLLERIDHVRLSGHGERRLPNNVNICVEFVEGESMLLFLSERGIAAASGSACTSRVLKASHVLLALGVPPEVAQGSLLFILGNSTTEEEIDYLLDEFPPIVERLRMMSPLYRTHPAAKD